jgi:dolichol kinase
VTGDHPPGSYRVELARKAIHLSSIAIPVFYFFTPKAAALAVLVPATLIVFAVDLARYYHAPLQIWFYRSFGWLLRAREVDAHRKRLSGATYVLISATLCVLLFPKLIALTSFLILIIADMTSALVGKRFGRTRFLGKSLEGSLAFFGSALLVVLAAPKVDYTAGEYLAGAAAAACGMVVEALPWDIDDNLTVPLSVGGTLWLLYLVFLPSLDLYRFG